MAAGEEDQPGSSESGFNNAEAYRQLFGPPPPDRPGYELDRHGYDSNLRAYRELVRKYGENPDLANLREEHTNEIVLERLSDAAIPSRDERWDPALSLAELRRDRALQALIRYKPERAGEAENVLAYNMARNVYERTPPTTASGNERTYTNLLKALERHAFGPEGPELAVVEERLNEQSRVFEWHGQPIELGIGQGRRTRKLELFRGGNAEWYLLSSVIPADGAVVAPPVGTTLDERIVVPSDGMVVGRTMTVPDLEKTRDGLNADTTISRRHVGLAPQPDGRIQITDSSTNGTSVSEHYWRRRQQPRE